MADNDAKCNPEKCEQVLKEARFTVTVQQSILGILTVSTLVVVPVATWLGWRSYSVVENAKAASAIIRSIVSDLQIDAVTDDAREIIGKIAFSDIPYERKTMTQTWRRELRILQKRLENVRALYIEAQRVAPAGEDEYLDLNKRSLHALTCAAIVVQIWLEDNVDRSMIPASAEKLRKAIQAYEAAPCLRKADYAQDLSAYDLSAFLWRIVTKAYCEAERLNDAIDYADQACINHPESDALLVDYCDLRIRRIAQNGPTDSEALNSQSEEIAAVNKSLDCITGGKSAFDTQYRAWQCKAKLNFLQGQYKDAYECCKRSCFILHPGEHVNRKGRALNNMACVMFRDATEGLADQFDRGKVENAISLWEQARDSQVADVQLGLAMAYQLLSRSTSGAESDTFHARAIAYKEYALRLDEDIKKNPGETLKKRYLHSPSEIDLLNAIPKDPNS